MNITDLIRKYSDNVTAMGDYNTMVNNGAITHIVHLDCHYGVTYGPRLTFSVESYFENEEDPYDQEIFYSIHSLVSYLFERQSVTLSQLRDKLIVPTPDHILRECICGDGRKMWFDEDAGVVLRFSKDGARDRWDDEVQGWFYLTGIEFWNGDAWEEEEILDTKC